MELVSFAKEVLQNAAERAASYRFGQSALRYLDRALWVVEKSARWAVPPPLDQDERPQPELIRPLPWIFFFALLISLRIARESISLVNLALGKPPLRSADVVIYIQSKRRYLRTLKYQGNRLMRTRTETVARESWYSHLQSLFEFTMCFRRQQHYANNNTQLTNGDEVFVVKRTKRGRQQTSPVASSSETTMERLIEKMMVDIDADSDESSSYTLTNVTSGRSEKSDYAESDQEAASIEKTEVKQDQEDLSTKENNLSTIPQTTNITDKSVEQDQDDLAGKENLSTSIPQITNITGKSVEQDQNDLSSKENSLSITTPQTTNITDRSVEQDQHDLSAEENNLSTSTPQTTDITDKSVGKKEFTIKKEGNSDTKEATVDFIQNEITTHTNDAGFKHYNIGNGCITQDIITTGR